MNPEFPFKLQAQKVTAPQLKASNLYTIYNCGKLKKKNQQNKTKKTKSLNKRNSSDYQFFQKTFITQKFKITELNKNTFKKLHKPVTQQFFFL